MAQQCLEGWDRDWGWQQFPCARKKVQCSSRSEEGGPESIFRSPNTTTRTPVVGPEAQVVSELAVSWSTAEESARTALISLGYALDRVPLGGWRITARSIAPGVNARVFIALDQGETQEQTTMIIKVTWAQDPEVVAEELRTAIEREASQRQPFDFQTVNPIGVTPQLSRGQVLLEQAAPSADATIPRPPQLRMERPFYRSARSTACNCIVKDAKRNGWSGCGPIFCE